MLLPKAKSNSFFSNSFFIFIIRFFPSLANLLILLYYSRQLPQTMYGDYQHFWIMLNVIYPLACFGIHVVVITYSREQIMALLRKIHTKYYLIYMIWVLALGVVFAALQSQYLHISFIIPLLFLIAFTLSIVLESFLIVFRSYYGLAITSILYSIAYCLIHWYVLKHGFSLQQLFFWLLIITTTRVVIYGTMARGAKAGDTDGNADTQNISKVRALWLHLAVYDITQTLFSSIDKFIVALIFTAQVSAIYYNGSLNIPFLPLLLSAAGSAVLIQLAANRNDDNVDIIHLMTRSGRFLSCIVFPLFFYLLIYRYELITQLLSAKYIPAIPVFFVSIMAIPLRAYSFTTVLQRMHKGAIINTGAILDLIIACALMYPLYKWLGLPGVALGFVITSYLQGAFYLHHSAKLLKVRILSLIPYSNWLIKLIVFACIFIAIHYLGDTCFTERISLILGGAVMAILVIVSLLIEFKRQQNGNITSQPAVQEY